VAHIHQPFLNSRKRQERKRERERERERDREHSDYLIEEYLRNDIVLFFPPCVLFVTKCMRLGEEVLLTFMFDEDRAKQARVSISKPC
jgi:hypothetical protein